MKTEFDDKAATWDDDPLRVARAQAIGDFLRRRIELSDITSALEYGSGTGLLSFALKDYLNEVTMMDESAEMTKVANLKSQRFGLKGYKARQYDLMKDPLPEEKYDLIYILLTLHHIIDYAALLQKFAQLLNTRGTLVIIDLEKEDGSFHDGEFHGHQGFDRSVLERVITDLGFSIKNYEVCYNLEKTLEDGSKRDYPLFMLIAGKEEIA